MAYVQLKGRQESNGTHYLRSQEVNISLKHYSNTLHIEHL